MTFEIALVEWSEVPGQAGLRVLGRTSDPELVRIVRDRLRTERLAELDALGRVAQGGQPGARQIPGLKGARDRGETSSQ